MSFSFEIFRLKFAILVFEWFDWECPFCRLGTVLSGVFSRYSMPLCNPVKNHMDLSVF
jgi:hypothetical protein